MNPKTFRYPYASFDIDRELFLRVFHNLLSQHVGYGFGSKAKPLDVDSNDFHGTEGNRIDCSGATRYILNKCGLLIPDGSVNQYDWLKAKGFKPTKQFGDKDGRIRMPFLRPGDTPSGIGHVVFTYMGMTYESHGGRGIDSRPWGSASWMKKCKGFVIDARPLKV